ncbi:MAG: universal stress protein [Candidatus Eisenbacteria bacterium]|nr:universal stress protein [Candidatus Eisenbacteria bacterium]
MFRKILVAVDGSTNSDRALEAAAELARLEESGLTVCHAFSIPERYRADLADELEESLMADADAMLTHAVGLASKAGVEADRKLLKKSPAAEAIVAFAAELGADLIVAGVRGKTADQARPLGSVSRSIAERAGCSVLLIRRKV